MAMAGDAMFRGGAVLMESCIYCGDTAVERRPYHKYCTCALHKNGGGGGNCPRSKVISYPIRRSWSEGNLAIIGGAASSPSSAAASPASGLKRTLTQESLLDL